jgi:inner membrane protein
VIATIIPAAYGLRWIFRKHNIPIRTWFLTTFLALGTHILLDCFTTYGTGILEPFSNLRVEWSTIAIVDVFYTVPFLILLLVLMFFRRTSKTRNYLRWAAIGISTLYLFVTPVNKIFINQRFKQQLAIQEIDYNRFRSFPLPLTNFLWMGVVETDLYMYTGYYSVFDNNDEIEFSRLEKNHHLAPESSGNFQKLKHFSKGWYLLEANHDTLIYNDLRFGRMGISKDDSYIFSFKIHKSEEEVIIEENNDFNPPEDTFNLFIERIFGKVN